MDDQTEDREVSPTQKGLRDQRNDLISYYLNYYYGTGILRITVEDVRAFIVEMKGISDMTDQEIKEAIQRSYDMEESYLNKDTEY